MLRTPAMNKVVLAFSGGLDTSVCIKYLQKLHDLDVITLTVDIGQEEDFNEIEKISYSLGSIKHVYINAKEEFVNDYVAPAIKANAQYQQVYPLATAIARPLIAKKCVEIVKNLMLNQLLMVVQEKVTIKFDLI